MIPQDFNKVDEIDKLTESLNLTLKIDDNKKETTPETAPVSASKDDSKIVAKLNKVMTEPWEQILQTIGYNNQDEITITAEVMKKVTQSEPRLLAYHTSSDSRPSILKEKGLYLLPFENGKYILQKDNIYMKLDYSGSKPVEIKKDNSSLVLKIGDSETSLIDNLRYSGVFERPEILGEPITHGSLMNGRHRINADMTIGGKSRNIRGVQYEVDSCFETKNKIMIIEGKSNTKEIDSFNIRQLYFPYRAIKEIVGDKKEIICVFIHKLKSNIHIWLFEFTDPTEFLSIRQTAHHIYSFIS